jgi:hypothetical protein
LHGLLCAIFLSLDTMSATNRTLVRSVLEHPTMRREYAPHRFPGHKEHFEFLLDHLDVCSVLSEHAGLINYRAIPQPDGRLYAENKEQASGFLALAGCEEGRRIFYTEGTQKGVFTVIGRGVVIVDYRQVTPTELEYSGKLFVRIDNGVVAALARLFFVFVKGAVDRNFHLVIAQPVDLTKMAIGCPRELEAFIQSIPGSDYLLVAPFADLLRTGGRQ